jgi:uncharacterized protein (DUF1800 family)
MHMHDTGLRSASTATPDPLAPFEPSAVDPFDLRKAGHLFRRTGYCADLATRRRAVRRGLARTMRSLSRRSKNGERVDAWADLPIALDDRQALRNYRVWRLLDGRERLAERMSMFWHDHFATSIDKVADVGAMARQLKTFDELGLGRFEELVLAIARDPAMLRWLDNDTNVQGQPNENFARELLELFTMGRGAGYTERDVQEAARAFTGYTVRDRQFRFSRPKHDDGEKTVLGRTGRFDGDDVVRLAVRRPETARFLATRILESFVHPQPTEVEVDAVADLLVAKDGAIGDVLGVLLRSRSFFSDRAIRSRIKDPLDWTVGNARALGVHPAPARLADAAASLGLEVGAPPSVEGWRTESAWLTSATWLRRKRFATSVLAPAAANAREFADLASDPSALVERVVDAVLDGAVDPADRERDRAARARLNEVARTAASGERVAATVEAVLLLPEASLL